MKTVKLVCTLFCLCLFAQLPAQKLAVTLYDSNWQPTTDKTQATYYRTSNFDSTGHRYIVQDYYATGQLYRT
ncbi:MAG: hypothetical protein Q8914_13685, partial [Bacteroidota bacterium]|nr:hypothetical protein [Bacteroidota bacterium]